MLYSTENKAYNGTRKDVGVTYDRLCLHKNMVRVSRSVQSNEQRQLKEVILCGARARGVVRPITPAGKTG